MKAYLSAFALALLLPAHAALATEQSTAKPGRAPAAATTAAPAAASANAKQDNAAAGGIDKTDKTSNAAFAGAWNGGFALLHNQETLVPQAMLIKAPSGANIVETTHSEEYHPEVVLAYHWYLAHTDKDGKPTACSAYLYGVCGGVFLAAGLGTGSTATNTVDTVIGGLVIGWGGAACDVENQKYNIGWGWGHRFAVSTLADGFVPNGPAPNGETQIRYQTKDIRTNGLFFTYTWGASTDCSKKPAS